MKINWVIFQFFLKFRFFIFIMTEIVKHSFQKLFINNEKNVKTHINQSVVRKLLVSFFMKICRLNRDWLKKYFPLEILDQLNLLQKKRRKKNWLRVKFAYSKRIFSCYFQKILKEKIKVAQICSNEFWIRKTQALISMTIEAFFSTFLTKSFLVRKNFLKKKSLFIKKLSLGHFFVDEPRETFQPCKIS